MPAGENRNLNERKGLKKGRFESFVTLLQSTLFERCVSNIASSPVLVSRCAPVSLKYMPSAASLNYTYVLPARL